MTEPFSASHLLKWGGTTVGAGFAYAVAAVETNPETAMALTPDIHSSLYVLIAGAIAAALKNYVPSEKSVNAQFDVLKAQHIAMAETLKQVSADVREAAASTHAFRLELAGWMGGVDARLKNLEERES